MLALIVANGIPPSAALARELAGRASLVVGADGGAGRALSLGISVAAVVGDLDSLSDEVRAALPGAALHRVERADRTDLEKAIEFCLERGATEIDVIGAGGGRADHAVANLSVLTRFRGQAAIRLVDDDFEVTLVDGEARIGAEDGTVVSLVAVGECHGVSTAGLRWDLHDFTLPFGTRGIHNEVARRPATVSVREGDLLLFLGRWVERHG